MITSVTQTIQTPAAAPSASQKAKNADTGNAFASLIAGASVQQPATTAAQQTKQAAASTQAPQAANTQSTQTAQTAQTAQVAPAASPMAASSSDITNFDFSPQAHESRMNSWLMSYLSFDNQRKVDIYNHDMEDWAVNEKQRKMLGLPSQPPPAAPQLAKIEPMPPGFWGPSGTTSV